MILPLVLAACTNTAPVIAKVNGQKTIESFGTRSLPEAIPITPGEDLEISIEVTDPQGGAVRLWWPRAPEGFDFPSEGTEGVWHVPEDHSGHGYVTLIAEDVAVPPEGATLDIAFGGGSGGTGFFMDLDAQ